MKAVNVKQAQTHLSKLIKDVLNGETVVITNHGHPTVRLVAERLKAKGSELPYGCMRKQLQSLRDDWNSPRANAGIADMFGVSD